VFNCFKNHLMFEFETYGNVRFMQKTSRLRRVSCKLVKRSEMTLASVFISASFVTSDFILKLSRFSLCLQIDRIFHIKVLVKSEPLLNGMQLDSKLKLKYTLKSSLFLNH